MVPKNTEEETQAQQKRFRSRRTIYSCGRTSVLVLMLCVCALMLQRRGTTSVAMQTLTQQPGTDFS